jgi:multiple sugar transport system substrate-binding protein
VANSIRIIYYPRPVQPLKVIVLALLIIPAILLLILGPRSDSDVPHDRVVIDYWEKWTADEAKQMRDIVDTFNDTEGKDKHIFVRYVSTSNVNQKTLVATAAGVPPDVAGLWDNNLAQFAELDALQPLEKMAAEHGITAATYKPVYWNACNYNGHLYALVSTPAAVALHYNTKVFADNADKLRAAGLDPARAPQTIDELDAYAKVLETVDSHGHLTRSGYLPMEPGWFAAYTQLWFGGEIWDAKTHKFTLTDPRVVKAYTWLQSYSKRLGRDAINEFQSSQGNFDTPQNAFLTGTVVMEQQGPWMANYILNLKPSMDGLKSSGDDDFTQPLADRLKRLQWAVAPFPSAVPGMTDVTYCGFDTLVIPRGAKHPREAFEFMAYVNRQDVMERLCKMHSKNSPLAKVSDDFLEHHKNPYIKVFERLARSPNAHGIPQIPIWPEVGDEMNNVIQRLVLLLDEPEPALAKAQVTLQAKYELFMEKQRARKDLVLAGQ